jgi:hypothetical protein
MPVMRRDPSCLQRAHSYVRLLAPADPAAVDVLVADRIVAAANNRVVRLGFAGAGCRG